MPSSSQPIVRRSRFEAVRPWRTRWTRVIRRCCRWHEPAVPRRRTAAGPAGAAPARATPRRSHPSPPACQPTTPPSRTLRRRTQRLSSMRRRTEEMELIEKLQYTTDSAASRARHNRRRRSIVPGSSSRAADRANCRRYAPYSASFGVLACVCRRATAHRPPPARPATATRGRSERPLRTFGSAGPPAFPDRGSQLLTRRVLPAATKPRPAPVSTAGRYRRVRG